MASNGNYDRNADFDLKKLEQLVKDSAVGDTMYEKKSVIEKVLEVGKHFQQTRYVKDNQLIELDPKIEDLMCTLWDISVEEDVSLFYLEHGVLDIFIELCGLTGRRCEKMRTKEKKLAKQRLKTKSMLT